MKSRGLRIVLMSLIGAALLPLIIWSGGFWHTNLIEPGPLLAEPKPPAGPALEKVHAVRRMLETSYEAVGTIRPRTEVKVSAQVGGQVLEVNARPGQRVRAGQLLVVLDDAGPKARLGQAKQGFNAARAQLERARQEHTRVQQLIAGQAATERDLEQATAALRSARAEMRRARQGVEEAQVALGFTRIKAPESGRVIKRLVEPGDLAMPGAPLLSLEGGGGMRLEAMVREGLIGRVKPGQELTVVIPALERKVTARVAEIVPAADPATRTFLVKADLPATPGLYSGMYGRLLVPAGSRPAVLIPERAVMSIGQLKMVRVWQDGAWRRVLVTLGREQDGMVEVLSGLSGGEAVAVPAGGHD